MPARSFLDVSGREKPRRFPRANWKNRLKAQRHRSQHRHKHMESRARLIITDRIYAGPQMASFQGRRPIVLSRSPPHHKPSSLPLYRWSTIKHNCCSRLSEFSGGEAGLDRYDGIAFNCEDKYSEFTRSASTLSINSRRQVFHNINASTARLSYSGISSSAIAPLFDRRSGLENLPPMQVNIPQLFYYDAIGASVSSVGVDQHAELSSFLESFPITKEDCSLERPSTDRFSIGSSFSPNDVLLNSCSFPSVPATITSASSSSLARTKQDEMIVTTRKSNASHASGAVDIVASIPSSPSIMFRQILKDPSWGLTPLVHAELAKCKILHFENAEQDLCQMLQSFCERQQYLHSSWGYLERNRNNGIYEPHRYLIVIWQIQHASKYKYQIDTLFRAVGLLDKCLSSGSDLVNRKMLWLLGVCCMCIAVKLEETQSSSVVSFMQDVCTDAGQNPCFTKEQLIWMESLILHIIKFECLNPTAATFIWHYLWDFRKDENVQAFAFSILCLSLTDYEILRFPASVISASAVFLTCRILTRVPPIIVTKVFLTGVGFADCVKRLDFLFSEATGMGRYTSDI